MWDLLREYFILFLIYSTIGWILEVIYDYFVCDKKIVNRGFLIGPYCPIYGIGCLAIYILLSGYKDSPIVLFVLSIVICSVLEYFTSFILEKIFKARWWDYSNRKLNINGRICMETMIPFGFIACFVFYIVNPFIVNIINSIPEWILNSITIIYAIALTLDIIISFNIVSNFKKTIKKATIEDRTMDINKYIKNTLLSKSVLYRRLIKAFPYLEKKIKNLKNKKKD